MAAARTDLQDTLAADGGPVEDEIQSLIRMHQKMAARLLREGSPSRAFGELVRASRAAPMGRRLAASLVWISLRAGTEAAAMTLLNAGLEETEGAERLAIRRQLVRLLRRLGEVPRAREHLGALLAERPGDRRARTTLHALLERDQRWEELDASLDKEVKDALAQGAWRRAARATLRRARLCHERLGDPARAALRYAQAAQYKEDGGDLEGALSLRILWLRALKAAQTPPRALQEAGDAYFRLAKRAGKDERARRTVEEMLAADEPVELGAPPSGKGRRITQQVLVAAADEAEARGQKAEAAALLSAAVRERPDSRTQQKLEAHLVGRAAWRELAQFYRDASEAAERDARLDYLSKLAEVLEDELHDTRGAAQAYGEIVELSGDRRALDEQVRLLAGREDLSGVRHALDDAVSRARDPAAQAQARVARGEAAFARRDLKSARADFEEAVRLQPANLLARAGLAEAAALAGERGPAFAFRDALGRSPRRLAGRADLFRRLARLAESPIADAVLARSAWGEVLTEAPEDEEALLRLTAQVRETEQWTQLEPLLRAQIRREPRGPRTRQSRLELVSMLERMGRNEEAVSELRVAVKFEPGHKDAWLALAQRLAAKGANAEAAWAYEQAASTTEDDAERHRTWLKLAEFCQRVLKDEARAKTYAARALNLKRDIEERAAERAEQAKEGALPRMTEPELSLSERTPPLDALTPESPPRTLGRAAPPTETVEMPQLDFPEEMSLLTPRKPSGLQDLPFPADDAPPPSDLMEMTTGDVVLPSEPMEPPAAEIAAEPTPLPRADAPFAAVRRVAQTELFAQVRGDPLSADPYRLLSDQFDDSGDGARSALMAEIADALAGDPEAAPRPPKLMLSATDRAGLRHPLLRSDAGELFGVVGLALCKLYPARGRPAGSKEVFRFDSGRGAERAADALLAAVRILGLRAPDVYLSEDNGPPFSLVFAGGLRVLVGKLAIKKELPDAELRFFAGRALFTQNPELLALRSLRRDQLAHGLSLVGQVLKGRIGSEEAQVVHQSLPPKALPRLGELFGKVGKGLALGGLMEGARHSSNRAGLVVCGGVAPAVAALRAKKALDPEITELVKFAASERYLQLRGRQL
jgi:Tfp pilus assembly protein PilF